MCKRRRRIKSKCSYFLFEHPNIFNVILRTSDEFSRSNFFSGVYHPKDTRDEKASSKKSGREYEHFDFIRRRLVIIGLDSCMIALESKTPWSFNFFGASTLII